MLYMILFHSRRNTNQHIQQAEMQTFELRNQGIKEEADKLQYRYVRRKKRMEEGEARERGERESLKEDSESTSGS